MMIGNGMINRAQNATPQNTLAMSSPFLRLYSILIICILRLYVKSMNIYNHSILFHPPRPPHSKLLYPIPSHSAISLRAVNAAQALGPSIPPVLFPMEKVRIPLAVLPVSVACNLLPIFVTFPNLFVPRCTESGVNYPVMRRLNITYGERGRRAYPPPPLLLPASQSACLRARQCYMFWVIAKHLHC